MGDKDRRFSSAGGLSSSLSSSSSCSSSSSSSSLSSPLPLLTVEYMCESRSESSKAVGEDVSLVNGDIEVSHDLAISYKCSTDCDLRYPWLPLPTGFSLCITSLVCTMEYAKA